MHKRQFDQAPLRCGMFMEASALGILVLTAPGGRYAVLINEGCEVS